jgi:hypothetical protein
MDYWIDEDRTFKAGDRDSLPLVHITQKWEDLISILNEGFKPSYCLEKITNGMVTKTASFPMISFSNVSVDYAISYLKSYGTFGIGLEKRWGEKNDLNPVLYLEQKSDLTNEIISAFDNIKTFSKIDLEDSINGVKTDQKSILTKNIIKFFAHSKNYDGELVRNNEILSEKYPFGMEREWRKIIRNIETPYFLIKDEIEKREEFDNLISNIRIDYCIEDLNCVLIEEDWQEDIVKETICEKFKLNDFPEKIKIKINILRHIPGEG